MENSIQKTREIIARCFKKYTGFLGQSDRNYEAKAPEDFADVIIEVEGVYVGPGIGTNKMLLKNGDSIYTLSPGKETSYSKTLKKKKLLSKGEELYSIALKTSEDNVLIPIVIIQKAEKLTFDMIKSLYGRAKAIIAFYKLNQIKQETILAQIKAKHYRHYNSNEDSVFSKSEAPLRYYMTKDTYTPDAQRTIEDLLENGCKNRKDELRLKYLTGVSPTVIKEPEIDIEYAQKYLDERYYKMDRVKALILDKMAACKRSSKKGYAFLFVGSPGVGKTAISITIAELLGLPFEEIPLNCISTPFELEGLDPGYESSMIGAIYRAYYAHSTSRLVIVLDEMDKMTRTTKEGDPYNVLYRLLTGEFYDNFLQCSFNTEDTVFIFTANSTDDIPEAILNRLTIVEFDDYGLEDKMHIVKEHIIPELFKQYQISDSKITFTDAALECIINRYCEDYGARDVGRRVDTILARIVHDGKADSPFLVTPEFVENVLYELVPETQALTFLRNKELYPSEVQEEIKRSLNAVRGKTASFDPDRFGTEKIKERIDYLLACKMERESVIDSFDPTYLRRYMKDHLYGLDEIIDSITGYLYTEFLQGKMLNMNMALAGPYGVGKTAIGENLANALGYHFCKISLNGVNDVHQLRGFSSTYIGSEPGIPVKEIKKAGTTKCIFMLDEIEKAKTDVAMALIDLLDRTFTDDFLGVPIDLSQTIFIATSNDWSKVPIVIRNRFNEINVEGYTRSQKHDILFQYIIPKILQNYSKSKLSITMDEATAQKLLKDYCTSFGIRDILKSMQKVVNGKLLAQAGKKNYNKLKITHADLIKYLGKEPIPDGNFPKIAEPGIVKALAVSGDGYIGSTFAIETVLIEGETEDIELTGLPRESAIDSAKNAVTAFKKLFPKELNNKGIHIQFGDGSVPKDGPSAGIALFMSIYSAAKNVAISFDAGYTGEISVTGYCYAVGGLRAKLQAACDSGCTKVFIPKDNYDRLSSEVLQEFSCKIIPVTHVKEVIEELFPTEKTKNNQKKTC